MNAINFDADNDGALNSEEATEGSDPYSFDTDHDGLSDGDELHLVRLAIPGVSLTSWDSNGDWYSDFDEYHGYYVVNYYQGNLPPTPGATYYDYDGDGLKNPFDPSPFDELNWSIDNSLPWGANWDADEDGDGMTNFYDPYPWDATNGTGGGLLDYDGDGIDDSNDPFPYDWSNYSPTNGETWYGEVWNDADGDGISNWEDPDPYGSVVVDLDNDADGLLEGEEATYGTSDWNFDSDSDGLTDYEEVIIYHTNPINRYYLSQSYGWGNLYLDGVLVYAEDYDNDGLPMGIELHYGLNDWEPSDAMGDLDGDGVSNLDQFQAGKALNSHLVNYDADGDGMTDIFENFYQLNPNDPGDAVEDPDMDGLLNFEEYAIRTNPKDADTLDLETFLGMGDLSQLISFLMYPNGAVPISTDGNSNGKADWIDDALTLSGQPYVFIKFSSSDLDGDGMTDGWEHTYGAWKYPSNGMDLRVDDSTLDADGDGLDNLTEFKIGTHPLIVDSDGDGVLDGNEDSDGDGLSNLAEATLGFHPWASDSNNDGTSDGQSVPPNDPDTDGLLTTVELLLGTNPAWKDHPAVALTGQASTMKL